jgi:hypothetical protein
MLFVSRKKMVLTDQDPALINLVMVETISNIVAVINLF